MGRQPDIAMSPGAYESRCPHLDDARDHAQQHVTLNAIQRPRAGKGFLPPVEMTCIGCRPRTPTIHVIPTSPPTIHVIPTSPRGGIPLPRAHISPHGHPPAHGHPTRRAERDSAPTDRKGISPAGRNDMHRVPTAYADHPCHSDESADHPCHSDESARRNPSPTRPQLTTQTSTRARPAARPDALRAV